MILKHNRKICDYDSTYLYEDPVFKDVVEKITPHHIFVENKEFLEAFADTIVNFSPISLNIIDYWNKDIVDNAVVVPEDVNKYKELGIITGIQPFEFLEEYPDQPETQVDPYIGAGYKGANGFGGSLADNKGFIDFYNRTLVGDCANEFKKRYYINSLIGIQDKLAYTHMNNFYTTTYSATQDHLIRQRLLYIMRRMGLNENFFSATNELFKDERFFSNKEYITKKGTASAVKYVGKAAYDAKIQGDDTLHGQYYLDVIEEAPFSYRVESNLLSIVYERFIKPLAHPIGMDYEFVSVCTDVFANKTEYPLIKINHKYDETVPNPNIRIECLCYQVGEETDPFPDPTVPMDCTIHPAPKIFATVDGYGLWEGISEDEGTGNIFERYEEGISGETGFENQIFKKYIFQNKNYLISYTDTLPGHTYKNITIRYYRYDSKFDTYDLAAEFLNQKHCNIAADLSADHDSYIDETFNSQCDYNPNGMFQFLAKNETTPPDTPAPSGLYEGFMGAQYGGMLWDELQELVYYGWFGFLGKDEVLKKGFSPSGFYESFGKSRLTGLAHIPEE